MFLYLKALHIIFIVTWFAGLFYMPRLLIYNAEAQLNPNIDAAKVLSNQFTVMMKRLWYGITFPSAIITLILGLSVLVSSHNSDYYLNEKWFQLKLFFVVGLYAYHFSLHHIFKQQLNSNFRYTPQQLRIWNECATVFLIAIVMLVVVKQSMSLVWGIIGLLLLIIMLLVAINIYKKIRNKK